MLTSMERRPCRSPSNSPALPVTSVLNSMPLVAALASSTLQTSSTRSRAATSCQSGSRSLA